MRKKILLVRFATNECENVMCYEISAPDVFIHKLLLYVSNKSTQALSLNRVLTKMNKSLIFRAHTPKY